MSGQTSKEEDADRKAVDELAREHLPALVRYFRRKGFAYPDDEDAAQEVFSRLTKRQGIAAGIGRFQSYLFATAANVAADIKRLDQFRGATKHDLYDNVRSPKAIGGPEIIFAGRDTLPAAIMALKELPMRTRTIFVLARLEHIKPAEIARHLGLSSNTVEKHLNRAAAYLGERLGRGK